MGDVAFNHDFDMLGKGDIQEAMDVFHVGLWMRGLLTPVPWVFKIMQALPGAARKWKGLFEWSDIVLRRRMQVSQTG